MKQLRNSTLGMYVNDAIDMHMETEVVLYFSGECYGTTDAIMFDEANGILHIHDLKTGRIPAHMEQLEIYAALFCLEYGIEPEDISFELRIYQSRKILPYNPSSEEIRVIMNTIIEDDTYISEIQEMEESGDVLC